MMEIEKSLVLPAPPAQVWSLLLDPQAMGGCVPGMESIEVVSPDEYTAVMRVKMAFISARFKLRTRIVERDEPRFLRAEGTGEDASVASSLKQRTEMRLAERSDGGTDLLLKVNVDLQGRMGSFGLSVMKTKADRLWDEFGSNLVARFQGPPPVAAAEAAAAAAAAEPAAAAALSAAPVAAPSALASAPEGWWPRLLRWAGVQPVQAASRDLIVVNVERTDGSRVRVEWPVAASQGCVVWLQDFLR